MQKRLHEDGLLARVNPLGVLLDDKLRAAFGHHPNVGEIRGRGLFRAIELVEDRATKKPFAAQKRVNVRLKKEALRVGLMCYPMGGAVDGADGDHVLFAPPFIAEEAHLDELVEKFSAALAATLEECAALAA